MRHPPASQPTDRRSSQGQGASSLGGHDPLHPDTYDLATIIDLYEGRLLRYTARLLEPRAPELEDVVQEAFLRLHRQVESAGYASITSLPTWLYKVTHNLARDAGRHRARQARLLAGATDTLASLPGSLAEPPPADDLVRREAIGRAMHELDELPEPLRETVILKVLHGKTLREIAAIMETSLTNVSYRLHQGLDRLATRLRQADIL